MSIRSINMMHARTALSPSPFPSPSARSRGNDGGGGGRRERRAGRASSQAQKLLMERERRAGNQANPWSQRTDERGEGQPAGRCFNSCLVASLCCSLWMLLPISDCAFNTHKSLSFNKNTSVLNTQAFHYIEHKQEPFSTSLSLSLHRTQTRVIPGG